MSMSLYEAANQHMYDEFSEFSWVECGPMQNGPYDSAQDLIDQVDMCAIQVLRGDSDQPDWPVWGNRKEIKQLVSAGCDPNFLKSALDSCEFLTPEIERELGKRLMLLRLKK